jgi:hypothetical protein
VGVPQPTTAVVPMAALADPAAVEMGETASSGTGGSEVDADVVQVQAPRDIGSSSIRHLPMINISTGTVSESLHLDARRGCVLAARSATFTPSCLPSFSNVIVVGDDV